MSFKLNRSESIENNVRRIARQQIDKAIGEINDTVKDRNEVVHQVRIRCKRLRALIRLVRPAMGKIYALENSRTRPVAEPADICRIKGRFCQADSRLLDAIALAQRLRGFEAFRDVVTITANAYNASRKPRTWNRRRNGRSPSSDNWPP